MNEGSKIVDKLVPVLVVVVVVMAFVMGAMWSKLQGLEGGGVLAKGGKGAGQVAGDQGAPAPVPNPTVSAEKMKELASKNDPPTLGNKDAKVTVVEFSDLQCPFCKQFADGTFGQIKKEYIDTGKIRFVFRHYPLRAIHPYAVGAGEATECAREQGKFWEMHDEIFANQTAITKEDLKKYAGKIGLNQGQFDSCVDGNKYKSRVEEDEKMGTGVGVNGTPAFFVNGKMISGAQPFDNFKNVIEAELK